MSEFRHETLREQVLNYIRKRIICLEYKNGEKIVEEDLSKKLGISRGPIREALRQLEQEGLVEYRQNKGCVVRELRVEDAAEIFIIRSVLECTSINHCEHGVSDNLLQRMNSILEEMKSLNRQNNIELFLDCDQRFHAAIASASGMKQLYHTWDTLSSFNYVLFLTRQRSCFNMDNQYKRHLVVYEALCTGDKQIASEAISEHYTKTSALFCKI